LTVIGIKGDSFTWDGRPVRLAGSHTWNTVQRIAGERISLQQLALPEPSKSVRPFTRLWTIETKGFVGENSLWGSNTPGLIKIQDGPYRNDGSLNRKYYRALERTVKRAERRDIVTGVVLFEGSIPDIFPRAWEQHPFNGLGPASHDQVHTQGPWNKLQQRHITRTVRTLEPYDNVIYEVGNELMATSTGWFQRWVVGLVKKLTNKPVGVSYARGIRPSKGKQETWMVASGADWIAPQGSSIAQIGGVPGFRGPQVNDTDHVSPLVPNLAGMQSAWNRGFDVLLMDGMNGKVLMNQGSMAASRAWIADL
jgi:hypothetical protein